MSVPSEEPVLDLETVREAAAHWRSTAEERARKAEAVAEGRYTDADDPARLAAHANRLLRAVRRTAPADPASLPPTLRAAIARGGVAPAGLEDRLFEAIINETRDFLSVDFLRNGLRAARSVGRVVVRRGGRGPTVGTGFLVSPRVMITNNHVLREAETAASATLEMGYEADGGRLVSAPDEFALRPDAFFVTNRDLDFSLVAVSGVSAGGAPLSGFGFLPLIAEEGKIAVGRPVNVIQHPGGRPKEVTIRENRLLDLPRAIPWAAHYEADTERGSSGAPVLNDRWEVVALHHSGVPRTDEEGRWLDVDGQPWQENDDPERIAWVGNEGIRVSRLVGAIVESRVRDAEKAYRDEVVEAEALARADLPAGRAAGAPQRGRPVRGAAFGREDLTSGGPESGRDASPAPAPRGAGRPTDGAAGAVRAAAAPAVAAPGVTLTVPLRITVSLGDGGTGGGAAERQAGAGLAAPAVGGALERLEIDPDYDSREGFDPDFCGFPAPLPEPGEAIADDVAEVQSGADAGAYELRYHHFSVVVNRARRLAFVSAVNLDPAAPSQFERQGSDRWVFDPRIREEWQAGDEFYAGNPLDRGHLTRRRDAAWGRSEREAKLANDDTFHWTNSAPQHEVFNQSDLATRRGLRLWGNLENHVLDSAADEGLRLSIFNGPVFRADDRRHRGLQVPREFFKVVAFREGARRARVLAFLLSQEALIRRLPQEALEEAFAAGPFAAFQVPLAEVERRTGLVFEPGLHAADPLRQGRRRGAEEAAEDAAPVPMARLSDMVLAPGGGGGAPADAPQRPPRTGAPPRRSAPPGRSQPA